MTSAAAGPLLGRSAMVMAVVVSVLLLLVGIGALLLLHVCIVGRAFRRGLLAIARGEGWDGGSPGLPPAELEKLPCYDFNDGDKGDCAVCLEGYQAGDRCRRLPLCGHSFHAQCVDSWLQRCSVCPICRASADVRKCRAAPPCGRGVVGGGVAPEAGGGLPVMAGPAVAPGPSHLHEATGGQ